MWSGFIMLFRSFLTSSSYGTDRLSYQQADWIIDRTGFEEFADLHYHLSSTSIEEGFSSILETLMAGSPPPGSETAYDVHKVLRRRWERYTQVPSPVVPRRGISQLGSAHGSNPAASPAINPVPPGGPPLPKGGAKKRPASLVGANPDLKFSRVQGDRAQLLLQEAQKPAVVAQAVSDLRQRLYAARTWASHLSEIKLWTAFCATMVVPPFPMLLHALEAFVAMMVRVHYAALSIPQYVSAIFRQQALMWLDIPEPIRNYRRRLVAAAVRDSGDPHRVLPITRQMLQGFRSLPGFLRDNAQLFLYRISVVTWFFLLRADESIGLNSERGLCANQFSFDRTTSPPQVTITLGSRKESSEGHLCRRTHACCCDPRSPQSVEDQVLPFCPFCAAALLVANSPEKDPKSPLLPQGGKPLKESHLLAFLREGLERLGHPRFDSDGAHNFGTHSLRRGAAQALVLAGWSLEAIRYFGRWLSDAIDLYLLQTPSKSYGLDVSRSMAGFMNIRASEDYDPKVMVVPPKSKPLNLVHLVSGKKISVSVPDLVPSAPDDQLEDFGDNLDPIFEGRAFQGMLEVEIISVLPDLPRDLSQFTSVPEIVMHSSFSEAFPDRNFSLRVPSDRCVLVRIDPSLPLHVLNLRTVPHSI